MSTVSNLSSGTTDLGISGLASGFDWQSLVSKLVDVERTPEKLLRVQQSQLQQQNNALGSIKTELSILQNRVSVLQDPGFFDSRTATSSDSTLATATADPGTVIGSYSFNITQLASAAVLRATTPAGGTLSSTDDVSALSLSAAGFATPVTSGTFTVNGQPVTIDIGDTLQDVFTSISTATKGAVTASYSAASDKITLTGNGPIVLGSATDTSNFLQLAKLNNNGTGTITSAAKLGAVKVSAALEDANFKTAVTDIGSPTGAFKINGVTINYNAATDSVAAVLSRINDSAAGVTASYDPVNNVFSLTNKEAGDVGIAVSEVSGHFLQAAGLLSGATLDRGKNLLYTLNDGPELTNQGNTITAESSGLTGLKVTVLQEGSFKVGVATDTEKIKNGIKDFVTEYNKVQGLINTQTATSTDASGKVTAGVLTGDQDTETLNLNLRNLITGSVSGLTGVLHSLDSLGFASNGHDDSLSTDDLSDLDSALASNLSDLKDLFTHSDTGLAVKFSTLLNATIGDQGSLVARQSNLTHQSADIDTQVETMERQVLSYQDRLTASFIAMETAQANVNQQLQFLQQNFK